LTCPIRQSYTLIVQGYRKRKQVERSNLEKTEERKEEDGEESPRSEICASECGSS